MQPWTEDEIARKDPFYLMDAEKKTMAVLRTRSPANHKKGQPRPNRDNAGDHAEVRNNLGRVMRARKRFDWRRFFEVMAASANVTLACRESGINRKSAYFWRGRSKLIRKHWDEALTQAIDGLEYEAVRRARAGVERKRPIFYRGKQCGEEVYREFSDHLLMFLLKAHRPERFSEKVQIDSTHTERRELSVELIEKRVRERARRYIETVNRLGIEAGTD